MIGIAVGENALLGAAFLLIPSRAADGRIESQFDERLLKRLGTHDVGIERGTVVEGIDTFAHPRLIAAHDQLGTIFIHNTVPELDRLAEFPG